MSVGLLAVWANTAKNPAPASLPEFYEESTVSFSNSQNKIVCNNPSITDGDTFRCGGHRIRLEGIDTAEMPGHCRPGRECVPGDPYAARDHLRSLTRGAVICNKVKTDVYGRTIARCKAGHEDLSCAMIDSGHAIQRYSNINC